MYIQKGIKRWQCIAIPSENKLYSTTINWAIAAKSNLTLVTQASP